MYHSGFPFAVPAGTQGNGHAAAVMVLFFVCLFVYLVFFFFFFSAVMVLVKLLYSIMSFSYLYVALYNSLF